MAYTIIKTDGTELTKIVDGNIDQTSTDLTLVGKNAASYGIFFNQNFVSLLENFASPDAPPYPITGQLWFDTSDGRLKVYDQVAGGFKVSGGTIVSQTIPSNIATGDIWIDSKRKQLYFNDGTATYLAGPQYSEEQGVSGFNVTTVIDNNEVAHTCVFLYVAQSLLGIFSSSSFTPMSVIPGYGSYTIPEGELNAGTVVSNSINVGFNAGILANMKFDVTATKADGIIDIDGVSIDTAGTFVSAVKDETTAYGTIKIQGGTSQTPLILGPSLNNKILVTTESFEIGPNQNYAINQNFKISTQPTSAVTTTNFFINAATQYIGIHNETPTQPLDIVGNTYVRDDLFVDGYLTLLAGNAPATLSSTGSQGQVAWDNNYIYICTATDTWKRTALNAVGGTLVSVSQDTSPQLGGNLDLNSFDITGTGDISISGTVTSTELLSANNTNLLITAPGTGDVIIQGLTYPSTDGSPGEILSTDGSGVLSWISSPGVGLSSRAEFVISTASIADGASDNVTITAYKGYALYKIETSDASWVRVYTSQSARTADASRAEGVDPSPGAGVVVEVITTGAETVAIAPSVIGFNDETVPVNEVYLAVKNKSGGTAVITVTLTMVKLES